MMKFTENMIEKICLDDEVFNKIRLSRNILEPLKKCVQKRLIEESDANMIMKRKITTELNNLEARERRIKDSFFDGDITREEWQEERANIVAKREELQRMSEKYADISKDIQITVNEVLDIATTVSDIMKEANPTQQNKLLSLMLAECYLDGSLFINCKSLLTSWLISKMPIPGLILINPTSRNMKPWARKCRCIRLRGNGWR